LRADGTYVWVFDRAYIVRAEDGSILRIIGALSDVTSRKALEEQLLQSRKLEAIGKLAGGVAHDFNNVLTVISGYTQLLLSSGLDETSQTQLQAIAGSAQRAAGLIRQLLAFSRRQLLQPRVFNVRTAIA